MFQPLISVFLGLVLALGSGSVVAAQAVATPTGDVVLTISGEIAITNAGDTLVLDRGLLMELPATTFETSTIWTAGVRSFTGVALTDLVAAFGIEGEQLLATAINDYTVEIPLSDAVRGGPIIAYQIDGEIMTVRDKGPLWLVYPYDSDAAYRTEVIYSRSIWQLDRLQVVE